MINLPTILRFDKKYNNSFIGIPVMTGKVRAILSEKFPGLIRCRRKHDPFRIMEAIFYLLRSGSQWRLLPACYPHWKSVYNKWRYWHSTGIFKRIHTFLLRHARKRSGRNEMPSVCHIDSASRRRQIRIHSGAGSMGGGTFILMA